MFFNNPNDIFKWALIEQTPVPGLSLTLSLWPGDEAKSSSMPRRVPTHAEAQDKLAGFSRIDLSADRRKQAEAYIGKLTPAILSKIFNLGEP